MALEDTRRSVIFDSDLNVVVQDVSADGTPSAILPSSRFVSATEFGVNPSAGNVDTELAAAVTYCKANNVGLFIPEGALTISSWTISDWNYGEILSYADFSAAGTIKLEKCKYFTWGGYSQVNIFRVEDIWYSRVRGLEAAEFIVAPDNTSWGQFWSRFQDMDIAAALVIDVGTQPCNQNIFDNVAAVGLEIKESAANNKECHNNVFLGCDFTGGYVRNTTAQNQHNLLIGCYLETISGGRAIENSFHILGMNFDVTGAQFPQPGLSDWRIANSHVSTRVADYAPTSGLNLCIGGDMWELQYLDGLPAGFANNGGTATIVSDADAPNVAAKSIELTATAGQTSKGINITAVAVSEVTSFCVHYEGQIASIEVYEGGALQYTLTPDDSVGTWTYFHGAVASTPGNNVQLRVWVVVGAQGTDQTVHIGYASFSPTRTAVPFAVRPKSMQTIDDWYQDDVAASQSSVQLTRMEDSSYGNKYTVPGAGSIVGVWVKSNASRSAGTLSVAPHINGVTTGLVATLDGSNTDEHKNYQAIGADTFADMDDVEIKITTDGSWAPVTADIRCGMLIVYDY